VSDARTVTTSGADESTPERFEPRRALLVHDAGDDADLVQRMLEDGSPPVRAVRVDSMPALQAALRARDWDVAIVAEGLQRVGFDEVMALLAHHDDALPIVAAGRAVDDAFVLRAVVAGARDVIDIADPGSMHEVVARALLAPESDSGYAFARLEHAGRHLRALARLVAELHRVGDREALLEAAVAELGAELSLPYLETWQLHDDGVRFVPGPVFEADGDYARLREGPEPYAYLGRVGLLRDVMLHRRSRTVDDLGAAGAEVYRRAAAARELGLGAVHATPVMTGTRVVAVLMAYARAGEPLSADDVASIDLAAAQLGATLTRINAEDTIFRERERVAALLDHVADGIAACDASGRLTLVNYAMEFIHDRPLRAGLTSEVWASPQDLYLEDGVTPMPPDRVPLVRAWRGERFEDSEYVVAPVDGQRRVLRASGQPITDDEGTVRAAVVAVRDVTDRATAELASTVASERALEQFSLLLDDLADLARRVGESEQLSQVWGAVLEFAHHTLQADELVAVRVAPDGALSRLYAARHVRGSGPVEADDAGTGAATDFGPALTTAVRESRVVLEHAAARPAVSGSESKIVRSAAAVPLVLEGAVLGGFEVRAYGPAAFDDGTAVALTMAANLAAIALDHADLVEGERRARRQAETAAQRFQQIFSASPAAVAITSLVDGRVLDVNPAMEALTGFDRDELIAHQAVDLAVWLDPADRERIVEAARDERASRGLEVPLRRKDGRVRTCLVSADVTELDGESAMLVLIVDVTERIEQEQRLQNLARFRESLMAFIGETLEIGFDGPFYQRLLASAVEVTPGAQGGSLLVRDGGGHTYRFVAAVGYDLEGLADVTFSAEEVSRAEQGAAPFVRRALPTKDERSDRADALRRHGRLDDIRCNLTVPIFVDGESVATLALDNFDDEEAFDDEAISLAQAFASQVATLIKRRALEHELEHMAYHDNLTGLPNRLLFRDRLQQAVTRAVRTRRRGAAIFIDLDNLKVTNDALGHSVGDELLKAVGQRLHAAVRADDTVARIGGDEFTMVLPDIGDAPSAAGVADKILTGLREPFDVGGFEVHVTASVGITLFPDDATDADTLIQHGDTAMYQAKAQGKDRYRFFTREMNVELLARASLEVQLRKAIERDELTLHYQPRVRLGDGGITSVEALARWPHPERGFVPPASFIPVAEEAGLIGAVGQRLLTLACTQAKAWEDAGTPVTVAFNLSAKQLQERDLVRMVRDTLRATDLDPARLELELTESAIMRNVEENVVKLTALRDLGVKVSIDDFGTAYSSLNYLKQLPANALKIDQSFVRGIGDGPDAQPHDTAIVRAVVALASALDMVAIAEGVETVEQLRFLRAVGCGQGQGYLFARPAEAATVGELLRAGTIALPDTP
jgi:diguanylate cyclase (GGDEF)-like protein/PAS domain S-box-containing protein